MRTIFVFGLGFAVATVGFVVACSSDNPAAGPSGSADGGPGPDDLPTGGDSGGNPTSAKPDPTAYGDALCGYYDKCSPQYLHERFGDLATCKTRLAVLTAYSLSARGNTVTPAQLQSCLDKMGTRSCADDLSTLAECDFRGTSADGAPCSFSGQCTSGECIAASALSAPDAGNGVCGTCGARAALNGDCTQVACGPNLLCVGAKCATPKKAGEACAVVEECELPFDCVNGFCSAPPATGQPCVVSSHNTCDSTKGFTCVEGTCHAWTYANAGAPCGFDPNAHAYAICNDSVCTGGTCKPRVKTAGAPCDTSIGCEVGLVCRNGSCADANPSPACR